MYLTEAVHAHERARPPKQWTTSTKTCAVQTTPTKNKQVAKTTPTKNVRRVVQTKPDKITKSPTSKSRTHSGHHNNTRTKPLYSTSRTLEVHVKRSRQEHRRRHSTRPGKQNNTLCLRSALAAPKSRCRRRVNHGAVTERPRDDEGVGLGAL